MKLTITLVIKQGRPQTDITKKRISDSLKGKMVGEKNGQWKGDDAGYRAIHKWINENLGRPKKCSMCGKTGLKKHKIHWANLDHRYRRRLADWISFCAKCHSYYDRMRGTRKVKKVKSTNKAKTCLKK